MFFFLLIFILLCWEYRCKHIRSELILKGSGVKDVITEYREQNFRWHDHVARIFQGKKVYFDLNIYGIIHQF